MRTRNVLTGLVTLLLALGTVQAQPALAQSKNSEPSKQEKLTHYSLYYENFKNENYASALADLRWMLDHAPVFVPNTPKGDDRHFRRAVETYTELAEAAESAEKKKAYLDTAYTMINTAPENLKKLGAEYDKYEWVMRKGRFLQQYGEVMGIDESPTKYYREAFNMAPKKVQPYYINQTLKEFTEQGKQQEALKYMDTVESKRSDDKEVMKILQSYREDIFGRNPAARIEFLEKKLKASPDDASLMAELFELYMNQGQRDKAEKLSQRLLDTNPSFSVYQQIAKMRLEDGRAQEAFNLYQKAMEAPDAKPSAQAYYNMGVAQRQMGSFPKARSYFRKALEVDPKYGKAYISIGDLYARAVAECGGSKMKRNDRAVYWLAVDMYQKAKQVDPSVASTANSKIQTYRKYFPTAEDLFYREDWEAGQPFRIDYGCYSWINATTTVRKPS